jgi:hypothetical protein
MSPGKSKKLNLPFDFNESKERMNSGSTRRTQPRG